MLLDLLVELPSPCFQSQEHPAGVIITRVSAIKVLEIRLIQEIQLAAIIGVTARLTDFCALVVVGQQIAVLQELRCLR